MDRDIQTSLDELQDKIDAEVLQKMGPEVYERWKNPGYMGKMTNYHAWASATGSCGNVIEIYLCAQKGYVSQASFFSEGCGSSVVCASVVCEWAEGKRVEHLLDLTEDEVMQSLPGLPASKKRYAQMAVQAMHRASRALISK